MKKIENNRTVLENRELLDDLINHHLDSLSSDAKADKKRNEILHVGKMLMLLNDNITIENISEKPDFIIRKENKNIGLEHQILVDNESKEREGMFEYLFRLVEVKLQKDSELPTFLANCYIHPHANFRLTDRKAIVENMIGVIKNFVVTGDFIENPIIHRISIMPHSQISISANLGAWWQKDLSIDFLLKAITKKEELISSYKANSGEIQWLLIVIGDVGESSYLIEKDMVSNINSEFDKIYVLEDFYNNLYELK